MTNEPQTEFLSRRSVIDWLAQAPIGIPARTTRMLIESGAIAGVLLPGRTYHLYSRNQIKRDILKQTTTTTSQSGVGPATNGSHKKENP